MTRLLSIIIVLTGIVVAVFNAPPPVTHPPTNIWTSAPATPLMSPLIFDHGYLWHPEGNNKFVYQSLTDENTVTHGDLPGVPVRWQAVPVLNTGIFHIFWINDRDELWHAQINAAGQFALPPVRLAEATILDFDAAALDNGGAIILWQRRQEFSMPIIYNVLDVTGRPRFPLEILPDASFFAVANRDEMVHVAWTTALNTDVRQRTYTLEQLRLRQFDVETETAPLPIPENRWLIDFELLRFDEQVAILYGTQGTDAPQTTDYQIILEEEIQPLKVEADALRWVKQSGENLTVSALIDGQWHAGIVDFDLNEMSSLRVIGDVPADASAVSIWANDEGQWNAGWATVDGSAILYHVISNWHEQAHHTQEINLSVIWLAVIWLFVAVGIEILQVEWEADQQRLLLLITYWSAKAGTALWWLNERTWQNGAALVFISAMAVASWYVFKKRNLAFFAVDAMLTVLWILLA